MALAGKQVHDSRTNQVHIVMPQHINSQKRLFGGTLVEWMDVVANVVGRRHCGHATSTLRIDNLIFKTPAYVGDVIVLKGTITHVGTTSMEVRVDVFVEPPDKPRVLATLAYLVLVGLDEHEKPVAIPQLIIETDDEKAEWEAGEKRYQLHKKYR